MGSPTSDDDPTRPVPGSGGWGESGPGPGPRDPHGAPGGPPAPPPGHGGGPPPPEDPTTTRFPPTDPRRGETAQFPAAGGVPQAGPGYPQGPGGPYPPGPGGPYPPQGPGGPYPPQGPYGYGGPPPGGGRSNRGLIIALVVGLVVLAGLAVALVVAFTRDEGKTVAADPSTSTGAAPTSSSSSSPSATESTSSAPSSTAEPAGDRTDELLATVPADFSDCTPTDLVGDGDVAAVECGPSTTQPGPETAYFYLYEDTRTLDQVFVEDAADLQAMPEGEDCATAQGVTTWNDAEGVEGGNIACTISEDGLLIAWTDRAFGIEGVVAAPGSTQEELAALAEWWRANSDFRS